MVVVVWVMVEAVVPIGGASPAGAGAGAAVADVLIIFIFSAHHKIYI